ncbi:MAG: YhcH/YjgK/YiaL family protein [Candidatus Andersenbacteria bacterium]
MITGHIDHHGTYMPFLAEDVWQRVLQWLKEEGSTKADGEYELDERNVYVVISTIETRPRTEGSFEAHRDYLDIHYCFSGGERIEWVPVQTLTKPQAEFNEKKDVQKFDAPDEATSILMTPGTFTVLLPEDAHMPKLQDDVNPAIKKAVVKIHMNLVK